MNKQLSLIMPVLFAVCALALSSPAVSLAGGVAAGATGATGLSPGAPLNGATVGIPANPGNGSAGGQQSAAVSNPSTAGLAGGATGLSLGAPLNGATGAVPANPGNASAGGQQSAAVSNPSDPQRTDYRGYSTRLSVVSKRIDENLQNQTYTPAEAAKHRAELASIRARFKSKDGHNRPMSAAQKAGLDSDIKNQEQSITVAGKP